jgi:23S rRNA (guanosine2251-2'-O)-methyltransferase
MSRDRKPSSSRGGGKGGMSRPAKGGGGASGKGGGGKGGPSRSAKGGPPSGGAAGGMSRPAKGGPSPARGTGGTSRAAKGASDRGSSGKARPVKGGGSGRSGMFRAVTATGGGRGGMRRGATPPGAPERDRGLGGEQVEGRQAVRELLLGRKRRVRELWVANDLDDADVVADILDLAADQRVPVVEVSRRKLEAEARTEAPQGVLAKAAPLREADLEDLVRAKRNGPPPFLVAVDGVTDPGNLGALLRSAEGAGVSGVLLPRHRAVHVTPTVAKASAGAVEHLPLCLVPGLPTALRLCKDRGLWIVGLDDDADRSLFDLGDLGAQPIVLVLGAEGAGLSRLVRERCDLVVSIPMLGQLSSLNVSAAGALACYEVARHRPS